MRRRLVGTPFLKPDSSCLMPLNHFFHVARKLLAPGQQGSLMCYLLPSWLNLKCRIFARAKFAPFPHDCRFPLFVVDLFCSAICCTVVRVLCCDWWWKPHLLKMCSCFIPHCHNTTLTTLKFWSYQKLQTALHSGFIVIYLCRHIFWVTELTCPELFWTAYARFLGQRGQNKMGIIQIMKM